MAASAGTPGAGWPDTATPSSGGSTRRSVSARRRSMRRGYRRSPRGGSLPEVEKLPADGDGGEIRARAHRHAVAVGDLEGLPAARRNRQRGTEARVGHGRGRFPGVDTRGAARVPRAVDGQPEARLEGVAHVALDRQDRVLRPFLAT